MEGDNNDDDEDWSQDKWHAVPIFNLIQHSLATMRVTASADEDFPAPYTHTAPPSSASCGKSEFGPVGVRQDTPMVHGYSQIHQLFLPTKKVPTNADDHFLAHTNQSAPRKWRKSETDTEEIQRVDGMEGGKYIFFFSIFFNFIFEVYIAWNTFYMIWIIFY